MYRILKKNLNQIKKSKKKKFFSLEALLKRKQIHFILQILEKIKSSFILEQSSIMTIMRKQLQKKLMGNLIMHLLTSKKKFLQKIKKILLIWNDQLKIHF